MALIVARHWSAQYEWFVHEKNGLEAGLTPAVVDAIRTRCAPEFTREDERVVYDTITELNETHTLSQPAYDRALTALGRSADRTDCRRRILHHGCHDPECFRRAGAGRKTSVALKTTAQGLQTR